MASVEGFLDGCDESRDGRGHGSKQVLLTLIRHYSNLARPAGPTAVDNGTVP